MNERLKELRNAIHLSQEALGNMLGISQQVISRIERDKSTMTIDHLLLLSDFYNVSTDFLLERTKSRRNIEGQKLAMEALQRNYELVQAYEMLGEEDRELVWALIEKMLELGNRKEDG